MLECSEGESLDTSLSEEAIEWGWNTAPRFAVARPVSDYSVMMHDVL